MKEDIKLLWIDALTSGEYKQGMHYLKSNSEYCCLGLLCDLHHKITGKGSWDDERFHSWYDTKDHRELNMLPREVCSWSGIGVNNCNGLYDHGMRSLTGDNDTGKSFLEIAEIIFENF